MGLLAFVDTGKKSTPSCSHHIVTSMPCLVLAGASLTLTQRICLCLACGLVMLGFIISAGLTPAPVGWGTHQQFGFPPCSFQVMFGIPCPSCGGTTSFAHFVRGEWIDSLRCNAAGFTGAFLSMLFVPWSLLSSYQGRSVGLARPARTLLGLLIFIGLVALIQWGIRLSHV